MDALRQSGGVVNLSETISAYVEAFNEVGEDIFVRRYSGSGPGRSYTDVAMRARVMGYNADNLVPGIAAGDRRVVGLVGGSTAAQIDLTLSGVPLTLSSSPLTLGVGVSDLMPITTNDKLVVRGREMSIKTVDDSTRRIGSVTVAVDIQASGAP